MSLFPDTRFADWTHHDIGSFSKRYFEPLWRSAMLDFAWIDSFRAQDLAQSFLVRELQRATKVFEHYEPARGHDAKFRTFLRTCFFRFARDELEKERRRIGRSLDALPLDVTDAGFKEFDRLVARDLLRDLRERITRTLPADARSYFDLKWPASIEEESASDREIAERLALTRAQLRTIKKRVAGRILLAIRAQIHDEGLRGSEADDVLEGYLGILGGSA